MNEPVDKQDPRGDSADDLQRTAANDQTEVLAERSADRTASDTVGAARQADATIDDRRDEPAEPTFVPPETLGPYRVQEKLGEGGMGVVYRAVHQRLQRPVALKLLTTDRMRSEAALARFHREMAAAGKLSHPNIVLTHDAGEEHGVHFLVMELIEGVNVWQLLARLAATNGADRQCRFPLAEACEIIRQAALGLECVHRAGLVHRDIKPSNLMVHFDHEEATVKVLDLGLARLDMTHDPAHELTAEGQMMGTVDYMAPEQADGGEVGPWSDIYSLGATLYKLLAGVSPYADSGRGLLEKLAAMSRGPAPSIRSRVDLPPALADLIDGMISPDASERPHSAAAVAAALAPWAADARLYALARRLDSASPAASSDSEALMPTRQLTSRTQRPPSGASSAQPLHVEQRSSIRWWATALVVLALLIPLYYLIQPPAPKKADPATGPSGSDTLAMGDNRDTANDTDQRDPLPAGAQEMQLKQQEKFPLTGTMDQTELPPGPPASGGPFLPRMSRPGAKFDLPANGPNKAFRNFPLPKGSASLPFPNRNAGPVDHLLASFIVEHGGAVRVNEGGLEMDLTTNEDLLQRRRFSLVGIDTREKVTLAGNVTPWILRLRSLRSARLAGAAIDDTTVIQLAEMKSLRELDLSGTDVTSAAMAPLAAANRLTVLAIRRTQVDDTAVPHLGKMSQLIELQFESSRISDAGRDRLREMLPNTKLD
ncbi:MAG: serine/threonine protein kinase [Planctomycetales bacterium]|nr:serine/threonine protein kinase [Planctomycetales bacterium]